jgi:hypothetical protein
LSYGVLLELLLVLLLALKLKEHLVVDMPLVAVLTDTAILKCGMVDHLLDTNLMELAD